MPLPTFTLKGLHVSKTKLSVYEENYLQTFSNCSYRLAETSFLDLFPNSHLICFSFPLLQRLLLQPLSHLYFESVYTSLKSVVLSPLTRLLRYTAEEPNF